jgi:type IV pilus assembly protein PilE
MKWPQPKHQPARGFSLIELLIVVVIAAILLSIAVPSYTEYVKRGKRAQARSVLLQAGLAMQRTFATYDSYASDRSGNLVSLPAALQQSPQNAAPASADYVIDATKGHVSDSSFLLVFKPVNTMAGDRCGSFTLDETGARDVLDATENRSTCWR